MTIPPEIFTYAPYSAECCLYGMFDDKGNLKNPPQPKQKEDIEDDDDGFEIVF